MRRLIPALLLLPLGACGYQVGNLYAYRDVRVKIFDNISDRRIHEFDLTNAIVHEMSSRGIRVNRREAEYTLEGTILEIRTPFVVEDRLDRPLAGSLYYRVQIRLVARNGEAILEEERGESVIFASSRGETESSARAEIFDRLARWIVTRLEKEW